MTNSNFNLMRFKANERVLYYNSTVKSFVPAVITSEYAGSVYPPEYLVNPHLNYDQATKNYYIVHFTEAPCPVSGLIIEEGQLLPHVELEDKHQCECGKAKHNFAAHSRWCPVKE